MLRITLHDAPTQLRIEVEGRLTGAWVTELEDCWRAGVSLRGDRPLFVDLSGVDSVDCAGRYLLALIQNAGGKLIASGCLMPEVVQQISGDWPAASRPRGRRG